MAEEQKQEQERANGADNMLRRRGKREQNKISKKESK